MSRVFEALRRARGTGAGQDGDGLPTVSDETGEAVGASVAHGDGHFKAETPAARPLGDPSLHLSPESDRQREVGAEKPHVAAGAADGSTDRQWAAAPPSQSTKRSRETLHVVTPKTSQSVGPATAASAAPQRRVTRISGPLRRRDRRSPVRDAMPLVRK